MAATDEQLINPDPTAMRHADDTLAFHDSGNPPRMAPGAEVTWVNDPNERLGRPGRMLATRNHEIIRNWASTRHSKPALLKAADRSNPAEALRFQISERRESEYEVISWDEWLRLFEGGNLVFVYLERNANGEASDLFRLVPAESVQPAS